MTKAADVYSFAMLMHELLTGQQLFEGMRQSQVIPRVSAEALDQFSLTQAVNLSGTPCPHVRSLITLQRF